MVTNPQESALRQSYCCSNTNVWENKYCDEEFWVTYLNDSRASLTASEKLESVGTLKYGRQKLGLTPRISTSQPKKTRQILYVLFLIISDKHWGAWEGERFLYFWPYLLEILKTVRAKMTSVIHFTFLINERWHSICMYGEYLMEVLWNPLILSFSSSKRAMLVWPSLIPVWHVFAI